MPAFICTACGTQHAPSDKPPGQCVICEDERQYVPPGGQTWTTIEALAARSQNAFRQYEPGLIGVGTQPSFAIGQRALLICTPNGNVLWDCISMLDEATVTLISGLGGLRGIAISHPHFYTSMVEWSRAFGGVPVHLHAADRAWVMRPDPAIRFWEGDSLPLMPDVTLIRCGGHFPGGTALHWAKGAQGRGVLCSADMAQVTQDRKFVTFMRSYPNFLPLSAKTVRAIGSALEPYPFDRIYGIYFDRVLDKDAKHILKVSVDRYVAAIEGAYDGK
jgi:glyoxylase-like metal-dependent hydrolase (beta-lactamase superfamily II)